MKTTISVIIPTYKPGGYLYECLQSFANQTLSKKDFELIIVLNGCKEPYLTDLLDWKDKHPNMQINLIQTDLPGVSNARNLGLKATHNEYIAFVDDDDYVSASYLEKMLNKATSTTVVLSNSISFIDGTQNFDETYPLRKSYYALKSKESIDLFHARAIFNGPCMKLLHRNIIQDNSFDVGLRNGEDSLFMFEISRNIKQILLADDNAIYYRRYRPHSASMRNRTLKERTFSTSRIIYGYINTYIKSPFSYNTKFFLYRILAAVKVFIMN